MGPSDAPPTATPPRRLGSVRRTTSHECTRPHGLDGPVMARCLGRDLLTSPSGGTRTLAETRIDVQVGFADGRIATVDAHPALPGGEALVGAIAYSGFRRAAGELLPDDRSAHTLRYQVLDDLPIALLLSGRVLRAEGISLGGPDRMPPVDVCAGWVADGFAVQGFTDLGPPLTIGPPPAPAPREDDPLAWHSLELHVPLSTRRLRRLDVWIEDGAAHVDSYLQDSYVDRDGAASTVHEYAVRAGLDRGTRRFVSADAVPGRLPFPECPAAAASAGRLVDGPAIGLRDRVSATMTGPASCTHLNDSLRSLEGVGTLLDELERHLSTPPPPPAEGQHEAGPTPVEEQR